MNRSNGRNKQKKNELINHQTRKKKERKIRGKENSEAAELENKESCEGGRRGKADDV